MSQNPSPYPSPYQPPNAPMYYPGAPDPLGPAKRASLLLFIMGPLGLLLGGCFFSVPLLLKAAPGPQADQLREQAMQTTHMSPDILFPAMAVLVLVPSLLMVIFAFFVRRGNRGATATSCVLMGLLLVFWLFNTIAGLFVQPMDGRLAFGLCFNVGLVAVFGLQLSWLIAALRASGKAATAQQQYAAQYWQYQQNMQAYAYAQQQQQMGYPQQANAPQGYAIAPPVVDPAATAAQEAPQMPKPESPNQ